MMRTIIGYDYIITNFINLVLNDYQNGKINI